MAMIFRDLQSSDFDHLKSLIDKEWYGEILGNMPDDKKSVFYDTFIAHYLYKCTYAEICEIDGVFAGVLIGRGLDLPLKFPEIKEPKDAPVPWLVKRGIIKIAKANDKMLSRCKNQGFDSELELYITHSDFRGRGVGSALLERFINYLKETGHKKMYLFTDDYCTYNYYLKRGFVEANSMKLFTDLRFHKFMILSKEY